jgi:hypothetical protein
MEENQAAADGKLKTLLLAVTLILTVIIIVIAVTLYVPLKEECAKCICQNNTPVIIGGIRNLTIAALPGG